MRKMKQAKKNNVSKIQSIISELSKLLVIQQVSALDADAITTQALEAFVSDLGADFGYYYLLDASQQDQLICRCHNPVEGSIVKLPPFLPMKHIDKLLGREKIFFLDLNDGIKDPKFFKTISHLLPFDNSYLFIRSKSHQDMLGILILGYKLGTARPAIKKKDEILDVFQMFTNVVIHQNIIEENDSRYQFECVLRDISKQMINPSPDQIDSEITNALKSITEFFNVDRGSIWQFVEEHHTSVVTHIYAQIGLTEVPKEETITADDFPYLAQKQLINREITYFNSIDELPEKAEKDRQSFIKWGTKSNLSIPLGTGKESYGTLSFDTLEKETRWPIGIISRAKVIGEIFSNTLARKYADEALRKSFREIKTLKDRLESENTYLQKEIKLSHNFDNIIGDSPALQKVLMKVTQSAPTDVTVIILGETGTGKELIARAVHDKSQRNKRPLIKVDCGSLPATMIERELFGHEKGAFTGAHQHQKGRFEIADGGTLFLDEIGELPIELQTKLLRVLQDGEFERLGAPKTRKIDVRIIAATNKDLEKEVEKGNFRSDLWYRLNIFPIHVPPLRERLEDIPKLVNWFVNKHSQKMGKKINKINEGVLTNLSNRHWAGNIRELENTIQRAVIISTEEMLELSDPLTSSSLVKESLSSGDTLESIERKHIIRVLEKTNGKIYGPQGAALILDLNPSTLRFRIKKLGIKKIKK